MCVCVWSCLLLYSMQLIARYYFISLLFHHISVYKGFHTFISCLVMQYHSILIALYKIWDKLLEYVWIISFNWYTMYSHICYIIVIWNIILLNIELFGFRNSCNLRNIRTIWQRPTTNMRITMTRRKKKTMWTIRQQKRLPWWSEDKSRTTIRRINTTERLSSNYKCIFHFNVLKCLDIPASHAGN